MGNRLKHYALVWMIIFSGCEALTIDNTYHPTRQETLYAEADAAAALAYGSMGTTSEDTPAPGPKPKPDKTKACPQCNGTGKLFGDGRVQPKCPKCNGSGKLVVSMEPPALVVSSAPPVQPAAADRRLATAIGDELSPQLDKLGDRIINSLEGYSLKTKAYYSDMEYTDERLVHSHLPEAKPTNSKAVLQREVDPEVAAELRPVTLVVGFKKDSPEHINFHEKVLPELPKSWTVRYVFYAPTKKLANNLLPKHLMRSGLNNTTLVGPITSKQLLSVAYPDEVYSTATAIE